MLECERWKEVSLGMFLKPNEWRVILTVVLLRALVLFAGYGGRIEMQVAVCLLLMKE